MNSELTELAQQVGLRLKESGLKLATAESCTGGWIAEAITAIAGSSEWFDRGFITYSNEAKRDMLGVCEATIAAHGAVSEEVVREMVAGALYNSNAEVAVSVSGIAGPGGATELKPVGTVWMAWQLEGGNIVTKHSLFTGDRTRVREQAVRLALHGLIELLK